MTKTGKPKNKTMHELAEEWDREHDCRNRVSDLEEFGKHIRYRAICEAWVKHQSCGGDLSLEDFCTMFEV